jgi:hypothetical protein
MIENSFNDVIPTLYSSIGMLNIEYNEKQIDILIDAASDLFGDSDGVLDPAAEEMNSYLKRVHAKNQTVTIADLITKYTKKPYGWYQAGIQCTLANLFSRGLVSITLNGIEQDKNSVKATLSNSRSFNAIVRHIKEVGDKEILKAKEILSDIFQDVSFTKMSSAELLRSIKELSSQRVAKLQNFANLDYPFKSVFAGLAEPYKELMDSNIDTVFEKLIKLEDELIDSYEDEIINLFEFMDHTQKSVYDECRRFLQINDANLRHFNQTKVDELRIILNDRNIYKNNKTPHANKLKSEIQDEFVPLLTKAREEAIARLDAVIATLQADEHFQEVKVEDKSKVVRPIQIIQEQIKSISVIDTIVAMSNDSSLLTKGLERIEELLPDDIPSQTTQRISINTLMPKGNRLKDQKDVEEYITALRAKMLNAIEQQQEILL